MASMNLPWEQSSTSLLAISCVVMPTKLTHICYRDLQMISLADIQAARKTIGDSVFLSPCAYSETFSQLTGNRIFFKLENLQMTGSFKERGAVNKLLSLTPAQRAGGVIAASAGNHAQGVA